MRRIIFTFLLLSFLGCEDKNRPVSFIYLNKLSGKTTSSFDDDGYVYIYIETILIDNAPQNIDSSFALQKAYFEKHNKICLLDSSVDLYDIRFYEKTKCTEYFIEKAEDPGGFSSRNIYEDCGHKDAWYSFYYKRDKKNPNMWIANMVKEKFGIEYHDTIYCDYDKNPPLKNLPKIPFNE